jgi:hypothetical protein
LLDALTTEKKKSPQEPGVLEKVLVVLLRMAITVAEPMTDPTVYVVLLNGKSAETKLEPAFLNTKYPPGSGLACVKEPLTVPPEFVALSPVTLAVGVILVVRLVCVPPTGVEQTLILGPEVEEIVPELIIEEPQSVLQLPEAEVMVAPPLFVMVPVARRLPLKVAVALLVKFPVMLAPPVNVEFPPLFRVRPPPRVESPPMEVVALMVVAPVTEAVPDTVSGPPLFTVNVPPTESEEPKLVVALV